MLVYQTTQKFVHSGEKMLTRFPLLFPGFCWILDWPVFACYFFLVKKTLKKLISPKNLLVKGTICGDDLKTFLLMWREKENRKAILSLGKSFKFWDEYKKNYIGTKGRYKKRVMVIPWNFIKMKNMLLMRAVCYLALSLIHNIALWSTLKQVLSHGYI